MMVNPIKIIGGWILLMIVIDFITISILFPSTVGGEQSPETFFTESITVIIHGIFLLNIITSNDCLYFFGGDGST